MARSTRRAQAALRFRPTLDCLEVRRQMSGATSLAASVVTNSVLVRFKDTARADSIALTLNSLGATVVESYENGPKHIVLGSGVAQWYALQALIADPNVMYAEADKTFQVSGAADPSDARYSQLWGLNNANDVDINAPEAWSITTGTSATIVAVLDTGIDITHPDLASKVWVNTAEISGNGVDDENDGYVDDYNGWNFVNNTNDVRDNNGHGSHVSGTIAAASDNGVGVTGVNWKAQIMPLKILDSKGSGTDSAAIAAIYYAVAKGARVINASWGGGDYSSAMLDAIRFAGTKGVLFVAAAGNDGTNTDGSPEYPADYGASNIISVAAVDSSGNLASFSNYGANSVTLAAPGVGIVSTINGGRYSSYSGTSMATPHVAGVVSLILGLYPQDTPEQVIAIIKATVKPLASLAGKAQAPGIIDAAAALTLAGAGNTGSSITTPPTITPSDGTSVGGVLNLQVGASSDDDVRASIYASDEYLAKHGGTTAGFLTGLYSDLMGRTPDAAGLAYFTGLIAGGASRVDVARWMMGSAEALVTKVARWYQSDLGRIASLLNLKADTGVLAYAHTLIAGTAGDALVRTWILGSSEFLNRSGKTNAGYVSALYQDLLGRPADATGYAQFVGLLDSGLANRGDVAVAIMGSPEAKQAKVAAWYQQGLLRTESLATLKANAGVKGWATFLGNL
ncbi:S8 family serine peptidase [Isosphaeraceae bacterium EP7]